MIAVLAGLWFLYSVDPAEVAKNLTDLNSNKFATREKAQKWLVEKGRWVEGVLDESDDHQQTP